MLQGVEVGNGKVVRMIVVSPAQRCYRKKTIDPYPGQQETVRSATQSGHVS